MANDSGSVAGEEFFYRRDEFVACGPTTEIYFLHLGGIHLHTANG